MGGQEQIDTAVLQIEQGSQTGSHTLGTVICPLRRRETDYFAWSVDQIATEKNLLLIYFDQQTDRTGGVSRGWEDSDRMFTKLAHFVILQCLCHRDGFE